MASDADTRTIARMRAALVAAHAAGTRVHVSGTSAAVFTECVIERIDAERVWLQPGNYPGAYTPRISELVLVAVVGGTCITRARGRSRASSKSLGGALEGVRKLSTSALSEPERARVQRAIALLASIETSSGEGESPPPPARKKSATKKSVTKPTGRRLRDQGDPNAPMLPLG